ncbi:MAG TPA: ferrous iron transport protein B [Crocinitomicaceae bacterium]|nr:ferrous iron transport protein B [Crocinitomicaceae bacterium]
MSKKIALVGNPNTGKTSLFNKLTGLHQKVGNYPGVTVDKKTGSFKIGDETISVTDLPGTYSLFPNSKDEQIVYDTLKNTHNFDVVVYVLDANNLERNLLFFSQLHDLGLPLILAITMNDIVKRKGKTIDFDTLKKTFSDIEIVQINPRVGLGVDRLKNAIQRFHYEKQTDFYSSEIQTITIEDKTAQQEDTTNRFQKIKHLVDSVTHSNASEASTTVSKWDKLLVHPIWGYVIFFVLMLLMFQMVYSIAEKPMEWIEDFFNQLASLINNTLSDGILKELLVNGILAGLAGTLVFIPQIALLFLFIGLLEESGYMARAVFLLDKLMRPFGLNGRSVVPMLSSVACAIPGIMATRTIANWKERMTTILVTPLISCSARIPVYILLIGLVIPDKIVGGVFHLQALVLFAMYFLGVAGALFVAWILKIILKSTEVSVLMLEIPELKTPHLRNVFIQIYMKVKTFVFEAGKIILAISIILWFFSSYGPTTFSDDSKTFSEKMKNTDIPIEDSYIGILGKAIEPTIRPLGYDWKIGISLITSFAAREVFVGTMSTIYSVETDEDDPSRLIHRMRKEVKADGTPVYSLATGLSLMVFYAFAMQCMSTLAVVKRETKSWKWPLIQFGFMSFMAYFGAWITFNIFS